MHLALQLVVSFNEVVIIFSKHVTKYSIFSGTVYNFVMTNFDMTDETRKMISQNFGILYKPTSSVRNIFGNMRDLIFQLSTRIFLNLVTQPQETFEELQGLSFEEFRSNLLSDRFQRILTVNLYYSGIWLLFGLSVLQQLANQRRSVLLRRKRELNDTERLHLVEDFIANLNLQLETYPSHCSN